MPVKRSYDMKYTELKKLFSVHESHYPQSHLTGYITFSSFGPTNKKEYPWESRTYLVSSNNKAFQPNKNGYSIFGSCLDGTDQCVRLEQYIQEEYGGKDGWVVEDCGIVGYLLLEGSSYGIGNPVIFYALEEAQLEMLSRMTRFANADLTLLTKQYRENNYEVTETDCYAEKYYAHASTIKESGSWKIQHIYISSPLSISFCHE